MASGKRKASAKTAEPPKKKVRVSETSTISEPEERPTTPKPPPAGMPQYISTRSHNTAKKQADFVVVKVNPDPPKRRGRPPKDLNATPINSDPPKRRGRPAKDPNAAPTKPQPAPSARTSVRGRPIANNVSAGGSAKRIRAKVVETAPVEKKRRGRPPKSNVSNGATEVRSKSAVKKGKNIAPKTTKAAEMVSQTTAKGTETPRKRGRPSKKATAPAFASLKDINFKDISDADDIVDQDTDEDQGEYQYWLMKAEPNDRFENGVNVKFSIDDLAAAEAPEPWDGVRNHAARNNMRAMRKSDLAFFYHSNCKEPGIVGVMRIVQEHTPDQSAFDPSHPYFDPKSSPSNPKWDCVHVELVKKFKHPITLRMLQSHKNRTSEPGTGTLANMQVLNMGRLSVSAVSPVEWRFILLMADEDVNIGQDKSTADLNDGYDGDTDGEVDAGPEEEDLDGGIAATESVLADNKAKIDVEDVKDDVVVGEVKENIREPSNEISIDKAENVGQVVEALADIV